MITTIFNIDIRDLVLMLVALLNFALGLFAFWHNKKEKINIYFALTALATALWALGLAMFRWTSDLDTTLLWAKIYYLAAIMIGASFLSFSFVFPYKRYQITNFYKFLFFLFTISIIIISVWPGLMIKEVNFVDWGKDVNLSWFYAFYVIYFMTCMIGAFGNFILKYIDKTVSKIQKKQIQYVFVGYIIAAIWGTAFNLFLPLIGNYKFIWAGPYFTLALIGFLTYAIFKHHLMNIKVIATEIFSALIVIISLINALLSQSRTEFFLKFGLFVLIAVFSVLLIRGVLNEVRSREKVTKMARSLKRANVELQKLDKAKSEFISIASHQLRTPVSVIKGVSSMMIEGDLDRFPVEKKERFIKSLWEKSCKLENIIDDILNATEMSNSKYRIKEEKAELIDPEELIGKIIKDFQAVTQKRGISLFLKKSFKKSPKIYGQRQYLQEALSNLIDNAIKYTPSLEMDSEARGKRNKKGIVSISITKKENNVIISIKDNGIGIPKEEIPNLFKKFARGSNARDMYTDGSGLGLFVVKEIIEGHYGKAWIESKLNEGTTFFVSLPIRPSKEINIKEHIIND